MLSRDHQLVQDVAAVCAAARVAHHHATDLDSLDLTGSSTLVVDAEHPEAPAALARGAHLLTVSCTSSSLTSTRGPRALVARSALVPALRSITGDRGRHSLEVERLLAVGLVAGPIEHALGVAAEEIAAAFGAERCVISVRGDSTGAASGTQTWSSVAWSETADRCRVASAAEATLVGMAAHDPGNCESVMAAPLECGTGSRGLVGVISCGARIYTGDERGAITALGIRLAQDVDQRVAHERTLEEIDRLASGPGLDALLGIWNRAAVAQLCAMYVSAAGRTSRPLTALVVDIDDLQAINNRHGVEIGDRVLRRVADALRAVVRAEDIVGRWAGDEIVVKKDNDFSENFDILTAQGYARYGGGIWTATCAPAWF